MKKWFLIIFLQKKVLKTFDKKLFKNKIDLLLTQLIIYNLNYNLTNFITIDT